MTDRDRERGFDYSAAMSRLCRDICFRVREFRKIDVDRIGFTYKQARARESRVGVWACVSPLLFAGGSPVEVRTRRTMRRSPEGYETLVERRYFTTPAVYASDGRRLLYLFAVMAPRFMNLSFDEKLNTVMHELFHIDPTFNGDVRRFPGKNWQHGAPGYFDAMSRRFKDEWLAADPSPELFEFLKWNFDELVARYSRVYGMRCPKIPLKRISEEEALKLEPRLQTMISRRK